MELLDGHHIPPASGGPARQLVVLCHGRGGDWHRMAEVAHRWAAALPDAEFSMPTGPLQGDRPDAGHQWFEIGDRSAATIVANVTHAAELLDHYIDHELRRLNLGPDDCAMMGFSQGSVVSLFAGLRRKVAPKGVIMIAGVLLAAETLPDRPDFPPVLIINGGQDHLMPVDWGRRSEAALKQRGVHVESLYPPNMGHRIPEEGLVAGAKFLRRCFGLA